MKNTYVAASLVLIASTIMLAGVSKSSFSASVERRTIFLKRMGVAFDMPEEFTIFQWEDDEGTYKTGASFGMEFRPGYLLYVPLDLGFGQSHWDCRGNRSHLPSGCIDALYRRVNEQMQDRVPGYRSEPEYLTLFGNKAVRFTRDIPHRHTIIFGYLRSDQLPEEHRSGEYLARLEFDQNVSPAELDRTYQKLVETVLTTLRVVRGPRRPHRDTP